MSVDSRDRSFTRSGSRAAASGSRGKDDVTDLKQRMIKLDGEFKGAAIRRALLGAAFLFMVFCWVLRGFGCVRAFCFSHGCRGVQGRSNQLSSKWETGGSKHRPYAKLESCMRLLDNSVIHYLPIFHNLTNLPLFLMLL